MRIGFDGKLLGERAVRAGFIGCGSHAFRNVLPTFQFAPVDLAATCDIDIEKARAFAAKFGATGAYADYRQMLARESLEAVFVVTPYDDRGRPMYPEIATECLRAGCHVWIEKPPAATVKEIEGLLRAAEAAGRNVMVGFKKMFAPANEKAKELAAGGELSLVRIQYPQHVPERRDMERYLAGENVSSAVWFLDHICHPVSLMLYLAGMPSTLYFERSRSGAGAAIFTYGSGAIVEMALTSGASPNGGMERTEIILGNGGHIVVENNVRVSLRRTPPDLAYGKSPSFYAGSPDRTAAVWEPEFSLGQLYNKGLFLLGYFNEVDEFARSILEGRALAKGTLLDAWGATRIFEAFAEGPAKRISLEGGPQR